ncbi:MAG: alanine racemase [Gammaproteobacteria bacterium]|nr:alanine racemase [Gammaproteobacteria bacterium]
MTRPARVIVDLDALRHNLSRVRALAPGARVMAIVKADAYGHGIERVAHALPAADAFGVACVEEAQQLLAAGVKRPIVLLEGPFSAQELKAISARGLEIVVHHAFQIELLERTAVPQPLRVWLKVDSGMHRLGFDPADVARAWARLHACRSALPPLRLMTHLARANLAGDPMTGMQLAAFERACSGLEAERSIANSAAIIGFPSSHAQWVRPGLMLYGVSPVDGRDAGDYGLRPAMTLCSELISIKRVRAGEPVGYGASWRCPEDLTIGVVAAGYGDGFPRHARSGTPVLVNGRQCAIIGFASMDMLTVDLRPVPDARIGDVVELWGASLPIERIAQHADTVPYELLCGVHKQRLSFIEHGKKQDALSM